MCNKPGCSAARNHVDNYYNIHPDNNTELPENELKKVCDYVRGDVVSALRREILRHEMNRTKRSELLRDVDSEAEIFLLEKLRARISPRWKWGEFCRHKSHGCIVGYCLFSLKRLLFGQDKLVRHERKIADIRPEGDLTLVRTASSHGLTGGETIEIKGVRTTPPMPGQWKRLGIPWKEDDGSGRYVIRDDRTIELLIAIKSVEEFGTLHFDQKARFQSISGGGDDDHGSGAIELVDRGNRLDFSVPKWLPGEDRFMYVQRVLEHYLPLQPVDTQVYCEWYPKNGQTKEAVSVRLQISLAEFNECLERAENHYLLLMKAGERRSNRAISNETGLDKETVAKYLIRAGAAFKRACDNMDPPESPSKGGF